MGIRRVTGEWPWHPGFFGLITHLPGEPSSIAFGNTILGWGICPTPNDFGRMGADPSHLTCWTGWRWNSGMEVSPSRSLHRLILTSATYRRVSSADPGKASIDGDNRYLWRMNRRRLEAEAYRDSVLQLAGLLDRRMGRIVLRDFVIEKPEHSPHYEYHLHDPMDLNPIADRCIDSSCAPSNNLS